ncbi:MAG: hypothetical protein AAFV80_18820 [Bacteroidota bacterium]
MSVPPRIIPGDLYFLIQVNGRVIEIREHQSLHMAGNVEQNSGPHGCFVHTSTHFQEVHNHHIERNADISLHNVFTGPNFCRNYDLYRFFPGMIEPGLRSYHLDGVNTHLAEASIHYRDEYGVDWFSNIGDQFKHHNFTIQQSEPIHGALYPVQLTQRVGGHFNCRLYDLRGNEMEVEYGEFLVDFHFSK